jgi:hypothetical protein
MKQLRQIARSERNWELLAVTGVVLGTLILPSLKRRKLQSANKLPVDLDSDGELRVSMSEPTANTPTRYSQDNDLSFIPHQDSPPLDRRYRVLNFLFLLSVIAYFVILIFFIVKGDAWMTTLMIGAPLGLLFIVLGRDKESRHRRKRRM